MSIYQKTKKYILILSVFFSLLVITHLIYLYLYNWSKVVPISWWTVSVWFVWNSPSLNPLEFSINPDNDYVLQFLYRSLIRYDIKTKKMEWDLANCDLWKNFSKIKCFVKTWAKWNDWTPITKDDVFGTYDLIKNTSVNKPLKAILDNIDITDKWDYIEFSSKNADVLLLDAFIVPIVKKEQVEKVKTSSWTSDVVFTWNWAYDLLNKDFSEPNIKKITLTKSNNPEFKNYIWKVVFRFFSDENTLLKNENSLNIIFPGNDKELLVSPRYKKYSFLFPQYIWLYLNSEKISNLDLRKAILFQLENVKYIELDEKKWKIINNPYLWSEKITPEITNKNLSSVFNSLGYYKKDILIWEVNKKYEEMLKPKSWASEIPSNIFIKTPSTKKIYFYNGNPEILISWNVPNWIGWVYVNDFKLKSFIPWNTKFYFRANSEFKTLNEWVNYYTLYFELNGKKIKKEVLTVYYFKDIKELEKKQKEITENLQKNKPLSTEEINKIKLDKESEIKKIQALDNTYYYDKSYNKFSLSFDYINEWNYTPYLTKKITGELNFLWIDVKAKEINQKDMQNIVKWQKDYDMLLVWVNHWLFDYNIFSFFYSGQAKVGFNFSKIKDISLDMLLEKLKSSQLEDEKLAQIKKETFDLLKRNAIVKTFYSPYSFFYIDKNIKDIVNVSTLPYRYYSYDIIKNAYIKEDRLIDFNKKSFSGFISWFEKSF